MPVDPLRLNVLCTICRSKLIINDQKIMDYQKSILLILILFFSISAKSQEVYHKIIGEEKKPGFYWDKDGVKHNGTLKLKFSNTSLTGTTIKFYQNGKKKGRLGVDEMESFLYGRDSFVLVKNFKIDGFERYKEDFAKVLENGKIDLYMHLHLGKKTEYENLLKQLDQLMYYSYGSGTYLLKVYLLKLEDSSSCIVIKDIESFKEKFIPLISANKKMTQHILSMDEKYWLDNLPRFVLEYNSRH